MEIFTIEKIMWGCLGMYWLVAAFFVKKSARRQSDWNRFTHLLILAIAFILLFYDHLHFSFFCTPILPQNHLWKMAGLVLCFAGLAFSIWARIHLGRNWSGRVTIKEGHELIQSGPYAITRNPMYTGFLTAFLGCCMTEGLVKAYLGIPVLVFGFIIKISIEEKYMSQAFGEKFKEYKMKVKRLIPLIY